MGVGKEAIGVEISFPSISSASISVQKSLSILLSKKLSIHISAVKIICNPLAKIIEKNIVPQRCIKILTPHLAGDIQKGKARSIMTMVKKVHNELRGMRSQ